MSVIAESNNGIPAERAAIANSVFFDNVHRFFRVVPVLRTARPKGLFHGASRIDRYFERAQRTSRLFQFRNPSRNIADKRSALIHSRGLGLRDMLFQLFFQLLFPIQP